MATIIIDHKLIQKKKKKLERIKKELKKEFIGIDYIIDELINYIQIWYLMPEVLTRPIIVNLWGMTGVGKTDLVRKLVSKLEFQDRFVEVELSNSTSGAMGFYGDTVSGILSGNEIDDGKPSIVLFDEIQRFNTIDGDGRPVVNTKYTDFWELLSDGKLAKRGSKDDINEMLERFMYDSVNRKKRLQKAKENGEEIAEDEDNTLGWWQAKRVKSLFGVEGDAMTLADMDTEDALKKMMENRKKKKIYEAVTYSKALIIISGNLDDAFSMASETSESDVDADIFHAYTKKITMVDVKQSLSRRFKPEQVARFGNIHLIYRSLQRKNFEALIAQEIDKIIVRNKELFGVSLKIAKEINQLIYQNGVFPVQGVRPVFSSVMDILESNLAQFLYEAFMTNQMEIAIEYNFEKRLISAIFGDGKRIDTPYIGRIDKIRQDNISDITANVSVHEAGHAVVYGVLFGLAPLQLKSKLASNYAGGFTFPHQVYQTKRNMLNKIKVLLAGGLAEELVFGADNATTGRQHDREQVGILANEFFRMYGFDDTHQAFYAGDGAARMDLTITDPAVEALTQQLVAETREILATYRAYLIDLSVPLHNTGSLTPDLVAKIAKKHQLEIVVRPEGFMYINGYTEQLGV
jgi:Peptidase family M41/ATPase family associated with various cellular activities (AAA)